MGTHPSEASPHSSPPDPLGSSCPPCRFPPCGAAAPRIRAVSGPSRLAARRLPRTGAFTDDGVVHTAARSLLSWSFPPFEDDLPASPYTSARLLSWAFLVDPSLGFPAGLPPRFLLRPDLRALFRVSENRKSARFLPVLPSVGFLPPHTLPKKVVPATPRGRDRL
jgi:hypothetical protein